MFWALGAHLGRGVSQSALGDVLGQVRDETPPGQAESARGYTSRRELSLHVDLGQIVGLMCVRQARAGGYSQYASGLAIYNEILATRPELMAVLCRGFPYHRRGEEAPTRRRSRRTTSRCSANVTARSACSSLARSSTRRFAT